MESDIWPPDIVVAISEKRVRSVRLPVVCGPHLLGMDICCWEDNGMGIGLFGNIYTALSCAPFILLGCFADKKLERMLLSAGMLTLCSCCVSVCAGLL